MVRKQGGIEEHIVIGYVHSPEHSRDRKFLQPTRYNHKEKSS
jgi:hypothetical protein